MSKIRAIATSSRSTGLVTMTLAMAFVIAVCFGYL